MALPQLAGRHCHCLCTNVKISCSWRCCGHVAVFKLADTSALPPAGSPALPLDAAVHARTCGPLTESFLLVQGLQPQPVYRAAAAEMWGQPPQQQHLYSAPEVPVHYGPSAVPYQQPAITSTYQQPATTSTYQQPATTSPYQQPATTSPYQQPATRWTGQQPPVDATHQQQRMPAAVASSWGGPASSGVHFPAPPQWHDPSAPTSEAAARHGADGRAAAPTAEQRHAHSSGAVPWGGRSPVEQYMM